MRAAATSIATDSSAEPAWRLRSLTPAVCRLLLVLLLSLGFLAHLDYLHNDCPIDLAGDEAQYWEWSRNLDLSYYSKGPLVAYIIAASTAIFGDTMPAVRYPALLLGAMTSIVTYLLTLRLFASDRLALGVVALYHLVPLFVAGSMLMTIDPPFYFCWALATYLLACAMFPAEPPTPDAAPPRPQGSRGSGLWVLIGVIAGVGFLAKYAMFLWFVPMFLALLADPPSRKWLGSRWPWLAVGIAGLLTTQVIVWNVRHDWVSFRHVSTQTGASEGRFAPANVLELVGGQIGVVGPGVALFMVAGVVCAFGRGRRRFGAPVTGGDSGDAPADPDLRRKLRFLAVFGVTFFAFTFVTSFRAKVQMNWPAPAYFTLMILAGWFISTRLGSRRAWRPWRPWFWFTIVFGLVMLPIAHHTVLLYPAIRWVNDHLVPLNDRWKEQGGWRGAIAGVFPEEPLDAQKIDFTYRLKGWEQAAGVLSKELEQLGPGAFALCHDYQSAAAMAFYLDGQPATYVASSHYQVDPGRMTQYDIWPDRDLGPRSPLVGRNAIFLGRHDAPIADLLNAFERIEGVTVQKLKQIDGSWKEVPVQRAIKIEIVREGLDVRTFRYFRCYGFKGMTRATAKKLSH